MTHTIYNTKAIVLGKVDTGEADNTLWLLTEDLGLVVASAQSARKEVAKMRPFLQTLGVLNVSMVRGKYAWRIVGAAELAGCPGEFNTQLAATTFAKLCDFIKRMTLPNTEMELFELLLKVRQELARCKSQDQVELIEIMAMAKLLIALGYMPEAKLNDSRLSKRQLVADINNAINNSQL